MFGMTKYLNYDFPNCGVLQEFFFGIEKETINCSFTVSLHMLDSKLTKNIKEIFY